MILSLVLALALQATPSTALARTLTEWRELELCDLGPELVRSGPDALASDPELARQGEAIALVARALREAGRAAAADALLDAAQPSEATRAWVELERARSLIEADELKAGLKILQAPKGAEQPVRFADHPRSWMLAGRALFRAGSPHLAAPLLTEFTQRWPLHVDGPAAWYMLAQHSIQERAFDQAQAQRERAAELSRWHGYFRARTIQRREAPKDPLPRLGIAQLWLQVGANAEAKAVLADLVALDDSFAPAWAHLGEAERKLDDFDAALAAYDRALALDGKDALVRANRGLLHLALGDSGAARLDLEIVCGQPTDDPRLGSAFLELARLDLAAGDETRADERYRRYRELGGTEPLR